MSLFFPSDSLFYYLQDMSCPEKLLVVSLKEYHHESHKMQFKAVDFDSQFFWWNSDLDEKPRPCR